MAALSAKAQREAAPIEKLPWRVTRKYGDDHFYGDVAGVRSAIRKDLENLEDIGQFWGDQLNRAAIEDARARLGVWYEGHLSIEFEFDLHTGTKYSVSVKDRRIP
jgi:hypothetical protein